MAKINWLTKLVFYFLMLLLFKCQLPLRCCICIIHTCIFRWLTSILIHVFLISCNCRIFERSLLLLLILMLMLIHWLICPLCIFLEILLLFPLFGGGFFPCIVVMIYFLFGFLLLSCVSSMVCIFVLLILLDFVYLLLTCFRHFIWLILYFIFL